MPSSGASALFIFAFLLAVVGSTIGAVIFGTIGLVWEIGLFVAAALLGGPE